MAKKLRSTISSRLLMEDPVKVKNKEKKNQEIFVKGSDQDVLEVKNDGGSFQLHRDTLKQTLSELKKFANIQVKNLDEEHTAAFRNVVEAVRLLYSSQAIYDLVLKDIHAVFSDVKNVNPGSVAAFFVGCFTDDKFTGPLGCSPKCASSLPPTEGTPGYASCEDLVLVYSGDVFQSLNEKRSVHCYVYVEDPNFKEFTPENVKQLKDSGIQNVTLILSAADGSYREIKEKLPVDSVPLKAKEEINTKQSSVNVGGVIFSILILVLVVLLIIFLLRILF